MNKLNVFKKAASLAGENEPQSTVGNDIVTITCNTHYDSVLTDVLASYYWDFALKQKTLYKDSEEGIFEFKNAFILPSDFLRISRLLTSDNIARPVNFEKVGNKIYTNEESLALQYVAMVDESMIPNYLESCIAYMLASRITYALSDDKQKSDSLMQVARMMLMEAQMIDNLDKPTESMFASSYDRIRRS